MKMHCLSPPSLLDLVQQVCTAPPSTAAQNEASFADHSIDRQIIKANYQPAPEPVLCTRSLVIS